MFPIYNLQFTINNHLNVFWFADIYINQLIQEIHLFGHKVDSGLKISGQMTKRGCLHLN